MTKSPPRVLYNSSNNCKQVENFNEWYGQMWVEMGNEIDEVHMELAVPESGRDEFWSLHGERRERKDLKGFGGC